MVQHQILLYQFGNEIQSFTGIADQLVIRNTVHSPNLTLQYRYQHQFLIDNFFNENTGGHWVNVVPGWIVNFSSPFSAGINAEIPVYRSLNGLQLSTTVRVLLSLTWIINGRTDGN